MDTLEAKLATLFQTASDEIDQLMALVQHCQAATQEADEAATLLRRYGELLEKISQFSWNCGLTGLQSVCALIETNLMSIQMESRMLTQNEAATLERWPMYLYDYLANQADEESSYTLVNALRETWPETLSESTLQEYLVQLMGHAVSPVLQAEIATHTHDDIPQKNVEEAVLIEDAVVVEVQQTEPVTPQPETPPVVTAPIVEIQAEEIPPPVEIAQAEAVVTSVSTRAASINNSDNIQDVTDINAEIIPETAPEDMSSQHSFGYHLLNFPSQQIENLLLETLASELSTMYEEFTVCLDVAAAGAPEERQVALDNYRDFVERIAMTADSVGLRVLGALCNQLYRVLSALTSGLSPAQHDLLLKFPNTIQAYLSEPCDANNCTQLAAILVDSAWIEPITEDEFALLQGGLADVQIIESANPVPVRQSVATWDDVSLRLPHDVNRDLLEGLLQELPTQVSAFTTAIELITSGRGSLKDVERAMRAAHTLKGAANTVGILGIAKLTHQLEDIMVALLEAERLPPRSISDLLINAGDCLAAMSEYLLGLGSEPDQALQVFQEVLDCANSIDNDGLPDDDSAVAPKAMQQQAAKTQAQAQAQPKPEDAEAQQIQMEQSLRVPATMIDELLRLAGETLISNSQIQERLQQSVTQTQIIHKQNLLLLQLVAELEDLVDIRGITSPQQAAARKETGMDSLEFEHYSELHTVTRRLIEAATDAQELNTGVDKQLDALDDLLEEQRRLQIFNQHAVMRTRMVTVGSVVSRLQRGVRQASRLLDKPVELVIQGENTHVDSQLLNDLMDPLMHILRNSVDHGIESVEDRTKAGKQTQGRIDLAFSHEGNSIVIRCRDDGAGLDYAAISRIAQSKGMLTPGHDYTEDELARQILLPGFSTKDTASQVSGRGVGLDIVYNRVREMKGMLSLNSRHGEGFEVELRMPAALLSTHTLIVRQRAKMLAISSRGVEDIRYIPKEQISLSGSREYIREGDNIYDLVKLENLLSLGGDLRSRENAGFPVLLTRLDDGAIRAVLVQEILSSRELVMKNFGRFVPHAQGVIGAVIMGDGSMAPVIDLVELLRQPITSAAALQGGDTQDGLQHAHEHKGLTAMVVDDSLSARRSLIQIMKDAGFEVRAAADGMDAVSLLAGFIPDIMLVDMEMPRMNGLELTSHVRSSERTRHIPVIMITSRTTEKHRQMSTQAGVDVHLTKPFNDDALLKHVMHLIQNHK